MKHNQIVLYQPNPSVDEWCKGVYMSSTEELYPHKVRHFNSKQTAYYPQNQVQEHPQYRMFKRGEDVQVSNDNINWYNARFKEHDYTDYIEYTNDPEGYDECDTPYRVFQFKEWTFELNTNDLWFPYCRKPK
jgi:hypothetical protein